MQGFSWFCIVLGICYFLLLGLEYSKYVQGQNWTRSTATVQGAINGLPMTKFDAHRINELAVIVNWSYIKYEYHVGAGIYQHTEELAPHLSIFDFMVGPMAYRFKEGDKIDIRYNEHDPKQTVFGFEVFRPVETLGGTGVVFLLIGILIQVLTRSVSSIEQESNSPGLKPPY